MAGRVKATASRGHKGTYKPYGEKKETKRTAKIGVEALRETGHKTQAKKMKSVNKSEVEKRYPNEWAYFVCEMKTQHPKYDEDKIRSKFGDLFIQIIKSQQAQNKELSKVCSNPGLLMNREDFV